MCFSYSYSLPRFKVGAAGKKLRGLYGCSWLFLGELLGTVLFD